MVFYKFNKDARTDDHTGFGTNASSYGVRFINKDGSANVQKKGIHFLYRISWYHKMLDLSHGKFFLLIFSFYVVINILFASIYYLIGIEHLKGIINTSSPLINFGNAFFFSTQTFTTVGYGHISPIGFFTSLIASIEALIGLLSFGIVTGLFFGRFSMPKAYIRFSNNAIIAPYKEGKALMLRLTPYKNTNFTDAEAKITLGMVIDENEKKTNKFFSLDLEMTKINTLTLSWTLVHPITAESPLFNFSEKDYEKGEGELIVFLKTFDDKFSTIVSIQTSYLFREIVYGAKFNIMYEENKSKTKTILHIDKLNSFSKVQLD